MKWNWLFSKTQDKLNKLYRVHLRCTTQIGSKISYKISLQGYIAYNLQKAVFLCECVLVKFYIPLFWKIGNI